MGLGFKKTFRERISDALDQALQDELAGSMTILFRRTEGREDEGDATKAFEQAVKDIKANYDEASRIIAAVFDVPAS